VAEVEMLLEVAATPPVEAADTPAVVADTPAVGIDKRSRDVAAGGFY
jgi:hypothetical protein